MQQIINHVSDNVTLTEYDSYGRLVSVNEINPSNVVFRSFNYQYDAMGRITQEENIAKSINLCYTYDELRGVTVTEKCDNGSCVSTESFTYDEAGN